MRQIGQYYVAPARTGRGAMRLLLLGGTQETHHIANAVHREQGLSVTVSLAKPERLPRPFGCPVRIGGFGGADGYATWLDSAGVDAVLDATHPYSTVMGYRSLDMLDTAEIEYVRYLRPGWLPAEGDTWTFLNDAAGAAKVIPDGSTVFVATGQRDLHALGGLKDCRIICRVKDAPTHNFPFEDGKFVHATGPFTVHDECGFLLREKVDWILSRNSGGQGSWPKIEAARELGIPVAMIRRPPQPQGPRITTVAEAIQWVRRRL